MSFEIRPLTESDDAALVQLFASASKDEKLWMWQDRSPSFFDLWKLACPDPQHHYLGVFHNDELIGCSGRNSCLLPEPFERKIGYVDTDLFVLEDYRTTRWAAKLFKARIDRYVAEVSMQGLLWGVEHEPGGLSIGSSYTKRSAGQNFYFPFESVLSHSPVFEKTLDVAKGGSCESTKLKDLSTRQLESFLENYRTFRKDETIFPKLDSGFLQRLQIVEPEAQILTNKDQTAGALMCSLRSLRRWKSTGPKGLVLERLRRARGWENLSGQEIKFQMLGMTWGGSVALEDLYRQARTFANEHGFDFLVTRDFLPAVTDPRAIQFKRRIFFGYGDLSTDKGASILEWTKDPKVCFRAEVFLI